MMTLSTTGCVTRYQHSNVKMPVTHVSAYTNKWCKKNKCPDEVKETLGHCSRLARKQDVRNGSDSIIIKEDIGDKFINLTMTAWKWLF